MVDASVPRRLNEFLYGQNTRQSARKLFVTLRFSALDIRYEHLDVSVSAEAALLRGLANMKCGRVAVVCLFDSAIQGGKLGENGKHARCFILHLFLLDKAAVTANAIDNGDCGSSLKLIIKPFGHAFFPGVGAELRFLESSALDVKECQLNLHQDAHSCWAV